MLLQQFKVGYKYKNRYKVIKTISNNIQIQTYLISDSLKHNQRFLLKILKTQHEYQIDQVISYQQELMNLQHKYTYNKIHDYYLDIVTNKSTQRMYVFGIIMDYFQIDSLCTYSGKLSHDQVFKIYLQLRLSLEQIHSQDSISFDKEKNIKIIFQYIISERILVKKSKFLEAQCSYYNLGCILVQLVTGISIQHLITISYLQRIFIQFKINQKLGETIKKIFLLAKFNDKHLFRTLTQDMDNIIQLNCSNQLISNKSAESIKKLVKLVKLDISGNNINDQFMIQIQGKLKCLKSLNLAFTDITDTTLQLTLRMTDIRQLDVSYTRVSYINALKIGRILQSLALWSGISEYYPSRYHDHIKNHRNFKRLVNQMVINASYFGTLQPINLKSLCINFDKRKINQLVRLMSKVSTCIETSEKLDKQNVEFILSIETLQILYLKDVTEYQISQLSSKRLKSLCLENCNLNFKTFFKSLNNCIDLTNLSLISTKISKDMIISINNSNLKSLILARNHIGKEGAYHLANNIKCLIYLDLQNNQICDKGATQIATHLKDLKTLNLKNNYISKEGVISIAKNLNNLRQLNLNSNNIDKEGAFQIAKNLKQLTYLDLGNNNSYIGAQGTTEIAKNIKNLTYLDLSYNNIGDKGMVDIANHLSQLIVLNLEFNLIGNEVFEITTKLKQLRSLNLSLNLWRKVIIYMSYRLKYLMQLDLVYSHIGPEEAISIAENCEYLKRLNLQSNHVGQTGVIAIFRLLKNLISINLKDNNLDDEIIFKISHYLKKLKEINLSSNKIYRQGAYELAKNLTKAKYVNLKFNKLSDWTKIEIEKMLPNASLII